MITITLTNGAMGDNATEADLEAWTAYFAARVEKVVGFKVDVRAARFAPGNDEPVGIDGADDHDEMDIHYAVEALWSNWCAEGAPRIGRPIDTSTPIGRLAQAMGGVDFLAAEIGVSTRTVRYWARGKRKPGGPAAKAITTLMWAHSIA